MEIGTPLKESELPLYHRTGRKYDQVWKAVDQLGAGHYLPVKMENLRMAQRLQELAKRAGYPNTRRKETVYITRRKDAGS